MKAIEDLVLEKCHADFLNICFSDFPLDNITNKVAEDITGYGTNINEKILSLNDFVDLVNLQRKESEGILMEFSLNTVSEIIFSEGMSAIFIDEGIVKMTIEEKQLNLSLRISSVFEYKDSLWKVVHFHGSIPQGEKGDNDTWAVNEWKQKNEQLERIIEERTNDLKHSLETLKATQSQLIHAEKMASLGELTAGIAHEIQNPLNFVNNFSEVSNELIDEMNEELNKGDLEEVKAISLDIKQNLEKINHHGKRADAIVKGMLQHSRSSTGTKEPTDINALADEYLRLAYHGLRAKDKSFNAELVTDFDDSVGNINVIPQDMGRVFLNLITNAFYAVNEKKQQDEHFKPIVSISTKKTEDDLEIKVTDNGNGIPQHVLDKIFQPFFTTKPTGQGTGLGLSLSYDIVKAHGGSLTVISSEGKGSEFSLTLPALA